MLPLVINTSAGYCLNEEPVSEITTLQLKFILDEVVNFLFNDVCSLAFREPVCPEKLEIFDYPYIVKLPIDLSSIKKQLQKNEYACTQECINDLNRMFNNCFVYNLPGTPTCLVGQLLYEKIRPKLLMLDKMSLYDLHNYTPTMYDIKTEPSLKRERTSNSKSKKPASKKIKVEPTVADTGRKKRLSRSLKACQSMLKDIMSKKHSDWNEPFLKAVNPKEVTDYYKIIKTPMDLGTVWKKLEEHEYNSKEEFIADVRLVYKNCYTYNGSDNFYGKCAESLEKLFESKLDSIPNDDQDITVVSKCKPISSFVPSSLSVPPPQLPPPPPLAPVIAPPASLPSTAHSNSHNNSSTSSRSSTQLQSHSKVTHNSSLYTTSPIHHHHSAPHASLSANHSKEQITATKSNNSHPEIQQHLNNGTKTISSRPLVKTESVTNFHVIPPVNHMVTSTPTVSEPPPPALLTKYQSMMEEIRHLNQQEVEISSKLELWITKFRQLSDMHRLNIDLPPQPNRTLSSSQNKLDQSQCSNTSMTTVALNDSNILNASDSNLPNLFSMGDTSPSLAADNPNDTLEDSENNESLAAASSEDKKMSQEELEQLNQDISKLEDVGHVLERFGLDNSEDEIDLQSLPYHKVLKLKRYVSKKLRKKMKSEKKERYRRREEEIALRYTSDSNLQPDYARSLFTSQLESAANEDPNDSPASSLLFPLPQLTSQVDHPADHRLDSPYAFPDIKPSLIKQSPGSFSQNLDLDLEQPSSNFASDNNDAEFSKSSHVSPVSTIKREPDLTTASATPSSVYSGPPKSVEPAASVKTSVKSSSSDSSSDSDDDEDKKPRWGSQLFQSKAFLGSRNEQSKKLQQEKNDEAKKAQQQAVARMIQNEAKRASQLSEKETANRIAKEKAEEAARRQKEEALVRNAQKPKNRPDPKVEIEIRKRAEMDRKKAEDRRMKEEMYRLFPSSPINSHELLCHFENKLDPYLFELFKI